MSDTTYTITFDFKSDAQKTLLKALQDGDYKLLAYKGASGPGQVKSGLPTWFAEKFSELQADEAISYTPEYKIYVYNQAVVGADTKITMRNISEPVGLGTAHIIDELGNFTPGTVSNVPSNSIVVQNKMPKENSAVIVGLAAKINGEYQPFCAFNSNPEGTVEMTPHEKVCLFAAQTDLQSGSVTGEAVAPGASFTFSEQSLVYSLAIEAGSFAIISDGKTNVDSVDSGDSLSLLLNSVG